MELLACIPELPSQADSVVAAVSEPPRPAEPPVAASPTPVPADSTEVDPPASVSSAPRSGAPGRRSPSRFPAPSIIALVAVAAVVWAAAWRNDRLRLEAARQQRPERLAQELPATAGSDRSLTP
jgi:hypothetical protein